MVGTQQTALRIAPIHRRALCRGGVNRFAEGFAQPYRFLSTGWGDELHPDFNSSSNSPKKPGGAKRRRMGGGGNRRGRRKKKEEGPAFVDRASTYLAHISDCMAGMEYAKRSANFSITFAENDRLTVDLDPEHGQFIFLIDDANKKLMMSSPVSGVRDYEWNSPTERWIGDTDYEDFEGMLTRDLLR